MDLASYVLFIFFTFFATVALFRPRRSTIPFIALLHLLHFLSSWLFLVYSSGQVTDSENYSIWAERGWMQISAGTPSIVNIVRAMVEIGVTRYSIQMLVFSALSCIGLAAAYIAITKGEFYQRYERKLHMPMMIAFLLPGLHFWTSPIGKDAIILFATGVLSWCFLEKERRSAYPIALLMTALVFVARPHVGACLFFAASTAWYLRLSARSAAAQRAILTTGYVSALGVTLAGFYIFFLYFVQRYSETGFESLGDFASSRDSIYADTSGGFDASIYPYPVRMLLFVLGGVPWIYKGIAPAAALLEGAVICIFLYLGVSRLFRAKWRPKANRVDVILVGAITFTVLLVAVLTVGATNFGIIARQRVMIYIPVFTIYMLASAIFWDKRSSILPRGFRNSKSCRTNS